MILAKVIIVKAKNLQMPKIRVRNVMDRDLKEFNDLLINFVCNKKRSYFVKIMIE